MAGLNDITYVNSDIRVFIPLGKLNKNIKRAQYWLDGAIMDSMTPYMPMVTGNFIQRTRAMSAAIQGSGQVCAAAPPYGRYLYEGKVMVETTGQPAFYIEGVGFRHHIGSTLIPTGKDLNYTSTFHPGVQSHWFEPAKRTHEKEWKNGVRRILWGSKT